MGLDGSDGRFHLAFVTANATKANRTDVRYALLNPGRVTEERSAR
jgi:hypothetical protein